MRAGLATAAPLISPSIAEKFVKYFFAPRGGWSVAGPVGWRLSGSLILPVYDLADPELRGMRAVATAESCEKGSLETQSCPIFGQSYFGKLDYLPRRSGIATRKLWAGDGMGIRPIDGKLVGKLIEAEASK